MRFVYMLYTWSRYKRGRIRYMVSIIFIFIFFTIFVINNNDLTPTYPKKEEEKKNFDPNPFRLLSSLNSTHPHHAAAAAPLPPLFPQHVFFQNFPTVRDDNNNSKSSSRSRSRSNFCSTSEQFLSQIILGHGHEWHIWCGREWNVGVAECLVSFEYFLFFFGPYGLLFLERERERGRGKWYGRGELKSRKDQLTSTTPPGPTKPPFTEKEVSHLFPTST